MKPSTPSSSVALAGCLLLMAACANSEPGTTPGTGGSGNQGTAGTMGSAGAGGTNPAGVAGTVGTGGTNPAGTAGTGGSNPAGTAGATAGRGGGTAGATAGRGGSTGGAMAGRGGNGGASPGRGGSAGTGTAGSGGSVIINPTPLDCGPDGWAVENHGPPANRVNYVILGDGYTAADIGAGGKFETHVNTALARRFSTNGQVYARYRNFVNICGIKLVSTGAICTSSSKLGCCGDDSSRLANCNSSAVNAAYNALPPSLSIDWRAVMLNGSSWWNSGGAIMYWSGGNADAPGAALHEGGHGFHNLADEYGDCTGQSCGSNTNGSGSSGQAYGEVNSCGNPATTDGKWDKWIGYDQTGECGVHSTFSGSRYVGSGQYRPTANSMMNSLFCNGRNPCPGNTAFNMPSRENMVMTIWRVVKPIDSTEPTAGAVSNPSMLKVNVVDPAVINVDWTVDGGTPMVNGGVTFDTSSLGAGSHTVSAKAYDNADMNLVRYRDSVCPSSVTGQYCARTAWKNSIQTVTWTFTK